jgi:hypothetical protein
MPMAELAKRVSRHSSDTFLLDALACVGFEVLVEKDCVRLVPSRPPQVCADRDVVFCNPAESALLIVAFVMHASSQSSRESIPIASALFTSGPAVVFTELRVGYASRPSTVILSVLITFAVLETGLANSSENMSSLSSMSVSSSASPCFMDTSQKPSLPHKSGTSPSLEVNEPSKNEVLMPSCSPSKIAFAATKEGECVVASCGLIGS